MKRSIFYIIICSILIGGIIFFVYKHKQDEDKKIEILLKKLDPLTPEETAQIVSKLYNELGPRIGSHLVEPNPLITIAGLRSSGDFLMHNLTSKEKATIQSINESQKYPIYFNINIDSTGLAYIGIINLKGLEYTSKKTKFPFVEPFDASSGKEGMKTWLKRFSEKAEEYFKDKPYKETELGQPLQHFIIGFALGYPDQALLDMYNTFYEEKSPLIYTKIPYSDYYEGAQPNFGYLPEHENEESILNTKELWGKFLKDFYNTSWHLQIAKDPTFKKTLEDEQKKHSAWFRRYR